MLQLRARYHEISDNLGTFLYSVGTYQCSWVDHSEG